jgi:hypothetical protein
MRATYTWTLIVSLLATVLLITPTGHDACAATIEFTDVRSQALEFIRYNETIELTAEQQAIFDEALDRIPAPCCSDNTARTCCCPCNMAKTWWGLSKHLISEQAAEADAVQAAVEGWIEFINPDGFSGDVCYSAGGCVRPFHENGCGGMNQDRVVF